MVCNRFQDVVLQSVQGNVLKQATERKIRKREVIRG
jgi:hypothetical protein